ncbi:CoA ester lyase [Verminephrobacter aporrectodeae subsp. tuberculatae]|uniref:HpcH/HpaI aldolase/citrate lyase family protein n=1 Tax=Verminephrobacter aporrectodeae TaxID=1110389 RepID=UPI002243FA7F|nr:CoA ester lyase [Verminephrobacter aporrectodeae]MCW8163605.1 CoA ester lyase [Verminephrobacter aporrectodeae subsp. tuberculatae]MCW8169017.1 CoA ester lyase [Verminephrobacter aporrectodeae subsp. tuberculatae]
MTGVLHGRVALARSFLFVPASRPERLAKALASGADIVVVDLEDAVEPPAKDSARQALCTRFGALEPAQRGRLMVRINARGTAWHAQDVALLAQLTGSGLAGAMLPKAEDGLALASLAGACPGLALLPLMESASGFHALDAVAQAPQVARLGLGHIDLQADLGMACGDDEAELAPARWSMVVASRHAGLAAPVDGVTIRLNDPQQLRADTARSRRFGFSAKLCIHPAQIAGVHAALAPTEAEVAWAHRVVDASRLAQGGAVQLDGAMVDAPVLLRAQQILSRQQAPVGSQGSYGGSARAE